MSGERLSWRRLFREPLIQFFLLGLTLFVAYRVLGGGERAERPDRIVVDAAQIDRLSGEFSRVWMRPPTGAELEQLIDEHITEEILYREALALGLDRDDEVVRRRLRQKMEFLNESLVEIRDPANEELQAWLDAHPDRYRQPAAVSFVQVYVSPDRHADPGRRAETVLARLGGSAEPDPGMGDPTLLPDRMRASLDEVDRTFGGSFAEGLAGAPLDEWSGPIASGYGLHLVRLTASEPARLPSLDEVRQEVERDWRSDRQQRADAAFYDALRQRYEVRVEMPAAGSNAGARTAESAP